MSIQKSLHHSFDINIAEKYGIEEAILIHHFQHWISINRRLKRNFHEGTYWMYQSLDEIAANFPYMTKDRIFNIIERLCTGKSRFSKKDGIDFEPILKKGNFNKSRYDRTVWYAFCDITIWLSYHNIDIAETQYRSCTDTTPIPDTITDTKTIVVCKSEPSVDGQTSKILNIVKKKDFDGKEFEISLEQIVQKAVLARESWSLDEIREAWDEFVVSNCRIRSVIAWFKGTIENKRIIKKAKYLQENKKCNQQNIQNSIGLSKEEETFSESKLEKPMDPDLWRQRLDALSLEMGIRKKY